MRLRNGFLMLGILVLVWPFLSDAEIYKWKDKYGTVRYTDTPPPSNIKQESIIGKKAIKPTGQVPLAPVVNTDATMSKEPALTGISAEEAAARLRQKNAEADKNNKKEKETQAKLKEENCKASRANLASYQQGGRIYKMNEKGEREYLDDAGLKAGAEKAQKEVSEYCNG